MLARKEIRTTTLAKTLEIDGLLSEMDLGVHSAAASGAQKNGNRRRFNDDQIKFLEYMFESESRPESQIKHQVANELGLQPRQVSIWFQNRRARLKSKQVEKEYSKLKASHDALASSFDTLQKENQSLLNQLHKLKNMLAKQQESKSYLSDQRQSSCEEKLENTVSDSKSRGKADNIMEGDSRLSNSSRSTTNDENDIFRLTDRSSDWHSFDQSSSFLEESSCSSQWWEFFS